MKNSITVLVICCFGLSCFAACPLADLTGDCRVDLADLAVFASLWLAEGIPEPGISWVSIEDSGVEGHEGFVGEMSKYETTNSQYCTYLNAALISGDIIVGTDNFIYGASGSNTVTDFIGKKYYDLDGSGCTAAGATNGGAARINWTGDSFSVDSGFEDHSVTYVSWYGATAFASYYNWRLPTEWEWQAAADFNGTFTYGCGTTINNNLANYSGSIIYPPSTHPDGTTVICTFGAYGYGLCDMAGNVGEWTASCYYDGCDLDYRVLRGGCWYFSDYYCTVSYRLSNIPDTTYCNYGFRVCH